jgi:hypothetical protein
MFNSLRNCLIVTCLAIGEIGETCGLAQPPHSVIAGGRRSCNITFTASYEVTIELLTQPTEKIQYSGVFTVGHDGTTLDQRLGRPPKRLLLSPVSSTSTCKDQVPYSQMAFGGVEIVAGVPAEKFMTVLGVRRETIWAAPSLGCHHVQDQFSEPHGRVLKRMTRRVKRVLTQRNCKGDVGSY